MRQVMQIVAAGIVAVSLTVGAGIASEVAARDDIPRGGDSVQQACRSLQQQAKGLVAEYGNEGTSDERRLEIQHELKQIGRDWNTLCRNRFGDIFLKVSEPDAPYRHPGMELDNQNWETYRDY